MAHNTERLGRDARRSDRLKVKINMLPTLKRNLPLTEPMSEEQIEKMDVHVIEYAVEEAFQSCVGPLLEYMDEKSKHKRLCSQIGG